MRPVAFGHRDEMAVVDREVPGPRVDRLDAFRPGRVERRALFVRAVQQHGDRGTRGGDRALAPRVFALVEHGAERELHHPVEPFDRKQGEGAVADLVRDGLALRSLDADDPRDVDRTGAPKPSGCNIWMTAPSHSACSPRSNACTVRT